jgi:hypothetical protein
MKHFPVRSLKRRSSSRRGKEGGAVAIIVALSLVALIGFVGLALDLGKLFVAKSELQNSADACALAAVRELTGANNNQLTLAEAAGIKAGQAHQVEFQQYQIAFTTNDSVQFSDALAGSYQPAFVGSGALDMRYARCTVKQDGIANWFIQVLNLLPGAAIGDQTVTAMAVASLSPSITTCAIPAGICADAVPSTLPRGSWLNGNFDSTGSNVTTGQFRWVDFNPPSGGANEVINNLTGPGVCNLPAIGTNVGQSGVASSVAAGWNSRFGISHGSVKEGDADPDISGYAYVPGKDNVPLPIANNVVPGAPYKLTDFQVKRGASEPYQGNQKTGLKALGTISNSGYLTTNGKDRRMATTAVIDCPAFDSGSTAPVTEWACVLMLHPINTSQGGAETAQWLYLEYHGLSNELNSPCTTTGTVGGPNSNGPLVPALVR